jgi:hypothetical protein
MPNRTCCGWLLATVIDEGTADIRFIEGFR